METGIGSILKDLELRAVDVVDNKAVAPGVYVLSLNCQRDFKAGQVIGISDTADGVPRLYSIASGKQSKAKAILFNVKEGGSLSPLLAEKKTGDTLYISEPFGSFLGNQEEAWWIASGTGIAPYISMYESGLHQNKVLIHGARTLQDFYFQDELLKGMPDRYIRCCSREQPDAVYQGRLTTYLRELDEIPTSINFYLCGSAEMVVEVRDLLISRGVPFLNIMAEIYF